MIMNKRNGTLYLTSILLLLFWANMLFAATPPYLVGSLDTDGSVRGVYVVDNYAYVADSESGLKVVDISNLTAPVVVGSVDTDGIAYSVQVVGNYAYVADYDAGLTIINISDPEHPIISSTIATNDKAHGLDISGNYAYVANYDSGLTIIDISDPVHPSLAGSISTDGRAYGVTVEGNYAYVVNADVPNGLKIFDISNPAAPQLIGQFDTNNNTEDVSVEGTYAYLADGGGDLKILDISDPASPQLVGELSSDGYAESVQILDNYAYMAYGREGLKIVDISDPENPFVAWQFDTEEWAFDVFVTGNYAYLANTIDGLKIIFARSSFLDIPLDYWALDFIESVYASGITSGCGNGNFCPEQLVTRAQMAVFLERGIHGADYTPPDATGTIFSDVDINHWAAAWIEQLYNDNLTSGCGNGNFCPEQLITRAQMAVFLLKAKHGSDYTPPDPVGTFDDVDTNYWAAAWIDELYAEGITSGCGSGNYCPEQPVTRAQMAVFLVRTFDL